MIFALRVLVNSVNSFSSYICMFVFLDLTVCLFEGFFLIIIFKGCNILAVNNANNHIFRPSVLIPGCIVPNSYYSI